MRTAWSWAAASLVGALAVAGCAQSPGAPRAIASGTATASAAAIRSLAGSPSPAAGSACGVARSTADRALTITGADNGKTFCVYTGTVISVFLRGTPSSKWMPVRATSAVLTPRTDPRMMLQDGVTGAAFAAARPGLATITSARYRCPVDGPAATSAAAALATHCGTKTTFRVTLVTRAR
jgi:hypothetical protein